MHRLGKAVAVAVGIACLFACSCTGGSSSPSTIGATATVTTTETVTATVTPKPSIPSGAVLGDTRRLSWGNVTPLRVDQTVKSDATLPGSKTWMGVLVRTCVTSKDKGKPVTLGWGAWTVSDRAGGTYDSVAWTGTEYPQPVYPMDRTIPVGQCVKGWIVFNKPAQATPISVTYGPAKLDASLWTF